MAVKSRVSMATMPREESRTPRVGVPWRERWGWGGMGWVGVWWQLGERCGVGGRVSRVGVPWQERWGW